ncbi:hypothetical protein BCR39DRAFT_488462 [Naematelia encephala]|uniref:Uncharacterized protein n=1 Tax=Naematelia encephala TaxID=71784 RepID=A0A1Y2AFM3_9TREE|nr:hypothetical protein BCR39DRAFT_488462 [Naematelia encephala]
MSDLSFADEAASPWATPNNRITSAAEPSVESTLEKERVIKDILALRDGLRGLLVRVTEVEGENDRLKRDNEMLGVYIDNLTRNSVVAAGNKL